MERSKCGVLVCYIQLTVCFVVDDKVLHRIEEAFKRHAGGTGCMPQATFVREVMGEAAPEKLSDVRSERLGLWKGREGVVIFAPIAP